MASALRQLLHRKSVKGLSDDVSYVGGMSSYLAGEVVYLHEADGRIFARVEKRAEYQVRIWLAEPKTAALRCSCTCLPGSQGEWCQHVVAAALTFSDPRRKDPRRLSRRRAAQVLAPARAYLCGRDKEHLIELLMETQRAHAPLREQLLSAAQVCARARDHDRREPDIAALRAAIDRAIAADSQTRLRSVRASLRRPDREAPQAPRSIDHVLRTLQELLGTGHPAAPRAVIELCQYALSAMAARSAAGQPAPAPGVPRSWKDTRDGLLSLLQQALRQAAGHPGAGALPLCHPHPAP